MWSLYLFYQSIQKWHLESHVLVPEIVANANTNRYALASWCIGLWYVPQIPNDPEFNSHRLSLLDRGFVFAVAHIRGGGELGRKWYENGKLLCKKNTFTDFINCAEYLLENKYGSKNKIAVQGRSAGGLLIGAVLTMRPDLFTTAIAEVAFVDVLTTMLDTSIPLTTAEWEVCHRNIVWTKPLNVRGFSKCI